MKKVLTYWGPVVSTPKRKVTLKTDVTKVTTSSILTSMSQKRTTEVEQSGLCSSKVQERFSVNYLIISLRDLALPLLIMA